MRIKLLRCLLKVILKQDNTSRNIPSYSKAYKAWKRSVVTTTIDVRVTKVSVNVNDRTDKVLEVSASIQATLGAASRATLPP